MFTTPLRIAALLLLPLVGPTAAQEPDEEPPAPTSWIGREAPALVAQDWLNLPPGEARPSLESLKGQVVLLEFWSTVRKACGKGLPHAQKYHERLAPHGLRVLALSYDPAKTVAEQVDAYGITVRLGTDVSMADFRAYQVPSVPYACVIGADGRVLYRGTPELAEPVIVEALGLEPEPGAVLETVARAADATELRVRLEWLIDSAPRSFDLAGFAAERADLEPTDAPPSGVDPAAALDAWVAALSSDGEETIALGALAATGAHEFDLRSWGWTQLARIAPIEQAELDDLLQKRKFAAALDALIFRAPSAALLQHARANYAFVEHCKTATREARALAKKALLAERWYLSGVEPRSRNAYWVELGLGGDPDAAAGEDPLTLVIGFERMDRAAAAFYFDEAMLRHLVSLQFASGRTPDVRALRARVPKERERALRAATSKHGQPADR